jgi:hypothetical protein
MATWAKYTMEWARRKGGIAGRGTVLFYKLHHSVLAYANRQLEVVPDFDDPDDIELLVPEETVQIRDALHENLSLLEDFVIDNPYGLSSDELAILAGWRHRVAGNFFIVRYLKKYTVFLGTKPGDSTGYWAWSIRSRRYSQDAACPSTSRASCCHSGAKSRTMDF